MGSSARGGSRHCSKTYRRERGERSGFDHRRILLGRCGGEERGEGMVDLNSATRDLLEFLIYPCFLVRSIETPSAEERVSCTLF